MDKTTNAWTAPIKAALEVDEALAAFVQRHARAIEQVGEEYNLKFPRPKVSGRSLKNLFKGRNARNYAQQAASLRRLSATKYQFVSDERRVTLTLTLSDDSNYVILYADCRYTDAYFYLLSQKLKAIEEITNLQGKVIRQIPITF